MFNFKTKYLISAVILFGIEVLIALFVHDRFIRPLGGDFLVVILLYCLIRGIFDVSVSKAAAVALGIAFAVEISQYWHLIQLLGLAKNKIARLVLGTTFSYQDMLCYTLGIVSVLLVEKRGN